MSRKMTQLDVDQELLEAFSVFDKDGKSTYTKTRIITLHTHACTHTHTHTHTYILIHANTPYANTNATHARMHYLL